MRCELHNGDCLEVMKRIPDHSVDMVLCDLPYGTTACKWDVVIPFAPLWEQYGRVCKENAAIVLFAGEPFTSMLIMSNIKEYRQKLTWLKTRPFNVFNAKKQFMNWTEDIVVFYKHLPVFNPQMRTDGVFSGAKVQHKHHDRSDGTLGKTGEKSGYVHESNGGLFFPKSVLEFSNVHHGDAAVHPTQKPVALLAYLIKTYTNGGGRQFWTTAWVRGRRVSLAWRRRGTSSASRRTRSILPSRKTASPNAAPKAFSNLCLRNDTK